MERLTQWIGEDEDRRAIPRPDIRSNGHGRCCNKLAEYEDAEKQGLLVRLPCKVGDTVYRVDAGAKQPIIPMTVSEIHFLSSTRTGTWMQVTKRTGYQSPDFTQRTWNRLSQMLSCTRMERLRTGITGH